MSKSFYKIPTSLDQSFADTEIVLSAKDITAKPMPIKIVLGYVVSFLVCFYLVTKSFISHSGLVNIILFCLLWFFMTLLLFRQDKTGIAQYMMIKSVIGYIPKPMRRIFTRTVNKATDFRNLTGIADVNYDNGTVFFNDGSCAHIFRVVGSGSILLFDEDRDAIISRVDAFYRKFTSDVDLIFLTNKEPQRVYRQLSRLKKRYDNLDVDDAELRAVLDTQFRTLKFDVGQNYRSIHQYLILKALNFETLKIARNTLLSEVENSTLVFKQCQPLFGDDMNDVFKILYQGRESV